MDPDILAAITKAVQGGASLEDINAALTASGYPAVDEKSLALHGRLAASSEAVQSDATKAPTERREVEDTTAGDVWRTMIGGATANFADEIAGGVAAAIPGGKGYTEKRDEWREKDRRFRDQHPYLSTGLGLVGSALPIAVSAPLLAARTAAGTAATVAPTVARRIATGAAVAGGVGGAYGAGASERPGVEKVKDAWLPALLGATVGAGVPAVGGLARAVGRKGAQAIAPTAMAERTAERELAQAMTPEATAAAKAMESSVPGRGILADLTPETQTMLDLAAAKSPQIANRAAKELGERAGLGRQDWLGEITRVSGGRVDRYAVAETAESQVARVGREVYSPLREQFTDIPLKPLFQLKQRELLALVESGDPGARAVEFLRRPIVRGYFRKANDLDALAGVEAQPSFGSLQRAREKLWQLVEREARSGSKGAAREYRAAWAEMTEIMEGMVPGFAEANARYAAAKTVGEAVEKGAVAWRPNADPRLVAQEIATLKAKGGEEFGAAAEAAYRVGMRDELIRRAGTRKSDKMVEWWNTVRSDPRLELAFPDPKVIAELRNFGDLAATRVITGQRVAPAWGEQRSQLAARLEGGIDPAKAGFTGVRLGGMSAMGARLGSGLYSQLQSGFGTRLGEGMGRRLLAPISESAATMERLRLLRELLSRASSRKGVSQYAIPGVTGQLSPAALQRLRDR